MFQYKLLLPRLLAALIFVSVLVFSTSCKTEFPDQNISIFVQGMTKQFNKYSGVYNENSSEVIVRVTSFDVSRLMVLTLQLSSESGRTKWNETSLDVQPGIYQRMSINGNRAVAVGTGTAELHISGNLSGIFNLIGTIDATDGYASLFRTFDLSCYLSKLVPISRTTRDLNLNGQIDAIELKFQAPLNDNFTDMNVVVSNTLVKGFNTGNTAEDEIIFVELIESGRVDTDRTPDLEIVSCTYLKDSTEHVKVFDDDGLAITPTDGASPVLMSAMADDGDILQSGIDAGDKVTMTYSEIIENISLMPSVIDETFKLSNDHTWLDGSGAISGFSFNLKEIEIKLSTKLTTPTIKENDTIEMAGNLVQDSAGNFAVGSVQIQGTFDPVLRVNARYTIDMNNNGHLDAIDLEYSLSLNDNLVGYEVTVTGYVVDYVSTGTSANDSIIRIHLVESDNFDTGNTPLVQVTASPYLEARFLPGMLALVDSTAELSIDSAKPVLYFSFATDNSMTSQGVDDDDAVFLYFSEVISPTALNSSNIDNVLQLSTGHSWLDGAGNYEGTEFNNVMLICNLQVSTPPIPSIIVGDTITIVGNQLVDSSGNNAIGSVILGGSFDPTLQVLYRRTVDANSDGHIDAVELEFNHKLNDDFSGLVASVSNHNVISVDTGTTSNDKKILIIINELDEYDTGETPRVEVSAGGNLRDSNTGNYSITPDANSVVTVDHAAPVLYSGVASDGVSAAYGIEDGDTVSFMFSEIIQSSNNITSANINTVFVLNNGHSWLDGAGAYGGTIVAGQQITNTLSANTSFPSIRVGDRITIPRFITDRAGIPVKGVINIVGTFSPPLLPIIRETFDKNNNGRIDGVLLSYQYNLNDNFTNTSIVVSGYTVLSIETGENSRDQHIYVNITERGAGNTDETPVMQIIACPDLADSEGLASCGPDSYPVGTTDGAEPVLISAIADDGEISTAGIDNDDFVLLSFSEPMTPTSITSSNIETALVLDNGHTWLDGEAEIHGSQWINNKTLKILLSTDSGTPSVAVGDRITPGSGIFTSNHAEDCTQSASDLVIEPDFGHGISSGYWTSRISNLSGAKYGLSAANVNDKIYVYHKDSSSLKVHKYDFWLNDYREVLNTTGFSYAPSSIYSPACVSIGNRMYIAGGNTRKLIYITLDKANPTVTDLGDVFISNKSGGTLLHVNHYLYLVGASGGYAIEWVDLNNLNSRGHFNGPTRDYRRGKAVLYDNFIYYFGGDYGSYGRYYAYKYDLTNRYWTSIANLPIPLGRLTAVVHNGLIYLLGGRVNSSNISKAVIVYNPLTDTYNATTEMLEQLYNIENSTAVLGSAVYLFGGSKSSSIASDSISSFHFSPYSLLSEDKSSNTSNPRSRANSVVIKEKAFIIGGTSNNSATGASDNIFEYDSTTDSWENLTSYKLPEARIDSASAELNGNIYVFGGKNSSGDPTSSVFMFNAEPSNNRRMTTLQNLPTTWANGKAVSVDGRIFLIGGIMNGVITSNVYEYNTANGILTQKAHMINLRADFATDASNGRIYVAGGFTNTSLTTQTSRAEYYDITNNSWHSVSNMQFSRGGCRGEIINNEFWVTGGKNTTSQNNIEVFNINLDIWNFTSSPFQTIYFHQIFRIKQNLYVFGGYTGSEVLAGVKMINRSCAIIQSQGVGPARLQAPGYTYTKNLGLMIIGGNTGGSDSNQVFRYKTKSGIHSISNLPISVNQNAGVSAGDYVFSIGGITGTTVNKNIYFYNYSSSSGGLTWQTASIQLIQQRFGATANYINERVYVVGGKISTGSANGLKTVESFQPFDMNGGVEREMTTIYNRSNHTSATYGNQIYIFGGSDSPDTAEKFNPNKGWAEIPKMPHEHIYASAVTFDDKIFVFGGVDENGDYVPFVDVFDPVKNLWIDSINLGLDIQKAACGIVDGKIIIACGQTTSNSATNTFYSYIPINRNQTEEIPTEYWKQIGSCIPLNHDQGRISFYSDKIYIIGGRYENKASCLDLHNMKWTTSSSSGYYNSEAGCQEINGLIYTVGGTTSGSRNCYSFNPSGNTFTRQSNMLLTIKNVATAKTTDTNPERILVIGGTYYGSPSRYVYHNTSGSSWTSRAYLPIGISKAAADNVNGTIWLAGGMTSSGISKNVYVFDNTKNSWMRNYVSSLPVGVYDNGLASVNNVAYSVGGTTGGSYSRKTYFYNPESEKWIESAQIISAAQENDNVCNGGDYLYRLPLYDLGKCYIEKFVPAQKMPWENEGKLTSTFSHPTTRELASSVWTGSRFITWGGKNSNLTHETGGKYLPYKDSWESLTSVSAPQARHSAGSCWTGQKMLVWGGYGNSGYINSGGMYKPMRDSWTNFRSGGPNARSTPLIWADYYAVVWGGYDGSFKNDGKRFEPNTNTWFSMSTSGRPSARSQFSWAWTGSKVIIWGGEGTSGTLNNGYLYDPLDDSWSAMATNGEPPSARANAFQAFTGRYFIVWGGHSDVQKRNCLNTGAKYDLRTNTWSSITSENSPPSLRVYNFQKGTMQNANAVWTGREMIIVYGVNSDSETIGGMWGYNPNTDTWRKIDIFNININDYSGASVAWTGSEIIISGGLDSGTKSFKFKIPILLDDDTTALSSNNNPPIRAGAIGAIAARKPVIWGGARNLYNSTGVSTLSDGKFYNPIDDTWSNISSNGAPTSRYGIPAISDGSRIFIWGGKNNSSFLNNGKVYIRAMDTGSSSACWQNISSTGVVPTSRNYFAGTNLDGWFMVWGGNSSTGIVNTGSFYDCENNYWYKISSSNAPTSRKNPASLWTGESVIIFGGETSSGVATNSGKLYTPTKTPSPYADNGSWTIMATSNAPSLKKFFYCWTGYEMLVFGAKNNTENDGGRYDPATNTWKPISMVNAPSARITQGTNDHGVWTGTEFIISFGSNYAGNQARTGQYAYNPLTDNWRQVDINDSNYPRFDYNHFWVPGLGRALYFGGSNGPTDYNNGFLHR